MINLAKCITYKHDDSGIYVDIISKGKEKKKSNLYLSDNQVCVKTILTCKYSKYRCLIFCWGNYQSEK